MSYGGSLTYKFKYTTKSGTQALNELPDVTIQVISLQRSQYIFSQNLAFLFYFNYHYYN